MLRLPVRVLRSISGFKSEDLNLTEQLVKGIVTGQRRPLPPPVTSVEHLWTDDVQALIHNMMHYSFIGDKQKVMDGLTKFQAAAQLDEIMVTSHVYDPAARVHSYEVLKEALSVR